MIQPVSLSPSAKAGASLILVDDDAALRHAVSFAFETQGYEVTAFKDAEDLLAATLQMTPVCIVLDQKLPGRSGLALLEELRARGVNAPAIVITSNPTATLRAAAAAVGVEIVEKPLLDHALEFKVHEAVRRSAAE